jgi:hypothetical protein
MSSSQANSEATPYKPKLSPVKTPTMSDGVTDIKSVHDSLENFEKTDAVNSQQISEYVPHKQMKQTSA